uniref:Lysophospholipid acyltransferase 7 n=1 Tax=Hymenolepis diminuta TaxID=6216 RepID=A0A0R3SXJ5_HYMDI
LIFFHTAHFYGFSKPAPLTQMFHLFLTLKVSPYYTYRTFNDMLRGWPSKAPRLSSGPFLRRLQEVPFFAFLYLVGSYFIDFDVLRDPAFHKESLHYRLVYIAAIFFVYRMRLYFAWVMGECVCMSVGLGAYPAISRPVVGDGPTDLEALDRWMSQFERERDSGSNNNNEYYKNYVNTMKSSPSNNDDPVVIESKSHFYNYATIQAVSVWKCEFSSSIRESFRAYNMTLYYWMDKYVYQRSVGPWILRSSSTLLINSLWYGIRPIYFGAHLTLPLIALAEDGMATVMAFFGFSLPPGGLTFIRWFFQMRSIDYLAAGWILLSFQEAWKLWSSFGYFVQVIGVVLGLAHFTMGRFVSAFERWTVENPGADVAEATARNLSTTGKAWEAPVIDTYV